MTRHPDDVTEERKRRAREAQRAKQEILKQHGQEAEQEPEAEPAEEPGRGDGFETQPAERPGAPPAPPEEKIAELERKVAELDDKYRRAVADLSNLHKRSQRERDRAGALAVADFVGKLLPALDNMSHSLGAADESHDPAAIIEGFKLVESQMLRIFADSGVEAIESVGRPFDPEVHHAVTTEVTDEVPPGTVTEELGRGFRIGDFVIRPAQVKVAAAPAEPEPEEAEETEP
ncbi:MAG: nucleotide exchange factor GrpE [Planctomycetota bacterium]